MLRPSATTKEAGGSRPLLYTANRTHGEKMPLEARARTASRFRPVDWNRGRVYPRVRSGTADEDQLLLLCAFIAPSRTFAESAEPRRTAARQPRQEQQGHRGQYRRGHLGLREGRQGEGGRQERHRARDLGR